MQFVPLVDRYAGLRSTPWTLVGQEKWYDSPLARAISRPTGVTSSGRSRGHPQCHYLDLVTDVFKISKRRRGKPTSPVLPPRLEFQHDARPIYGSPLVRMRAPRFSSTVRREAVASGRRNYDKSPIRANERVRVSTSIELRVTGKMCRADLTSRFRQSAVNLHTKYGSVQV